MPAWAAWTGFGFTVVGALLTAAAFWYARGAKQAAEAATEAANQAKEAVSDRVTIADLAGIASSLTGIISWLAAEKLELAWHEVLLVRQRVIGLRERRGFEERRADLNKLIGTLADLQQTIERKLWTEHAMPMPLAEISTSLAEHSDQLAAWGERMRFE